MTQRALSGVRVLDLTRLLPGPYAMHMLQGMGADVIKIEDTGAGDYARFLRPMPATGMGTAFTVSNPGKRSLAVNLKDEAGRQVLRELAAQADVLTESFRPGVMQRLGLSYEALKAINPRLVYCSLTGYGQNGPLAHLGGHDLNYQGYAGVLPRSAEDGRASMPQTLTSDLAGGSYSCVLAIMAALLARQATGRGRYIDLSIVDSTLMFAPLDAAQVAQGCVSPAPGTDRLNGGHPCYGLYDTSDGRQVTFAALEEKFWVSFCQNAGCEQLLEEDDLMDPAVATRVRAALSGIFASRTQAEWVALGEAWDVCLGPVWSAAEALVGADQRNAPVWRTVATDGEAVRVLRGGGVDGACAEAALPLQGQHTREILGELGWSQGAIEALFEKGVLSES